MKLVVITNHTSHIQKILGLDPNIPEFVIVTPDTTERLYGLQDFYYYPMRPLYAREQQIIESHDGKSINRLEFFDMLEAEMEAKNE